MRAQEERVALLGAAEELGLQLASPAHAQLQAWLSERPPDALFEVCCDYARSAGSRATRRASSPG